MNTNIPLIETIRIQNGRVRNIKHHNNRFNEARKALFNINQKFNLRKVIDDEHFPDFPEVKCRITYDIRIIKVEFEAYKLRPIHSLQRVEIGDYTYSYKSKDRAQLVHFYNQRKDQDDILMTRKGWLTDTYYANVALLNEGEWYTPQDPLLKGTQRARLLEQNKITPKNIHINDIHGFETISVFNAMIPFKKILIPTKAISLL